MTGLINLDKPARVSSAAVVGQVKRLLPRGVKIGHAGTLDPFATGVLLLMVGRATRCAERFMSEPKQYEATICLGASSPTFDPDPPITLNPDAVPLAREAIEEVLPRFIGRVMQQPPAYSALKIDGKPAYAWMRQGHAVTLQPREVTIYDIEMLDYRWPLLRLRIDCGRGTYIRSLARDIGEVLRVGGYVAALRRTRIGTFTVEDAVTLQRLASEGVAGFLRAV
jgi:tRNA pseudouridine55 synthase